MDLDQQVVNCNEYSLVGTADDFVTAITALAARTELAGHPGVLEYRFFVDRENGTAGAIIVYADVEAWKQHHEIAYQWDEMGVLQSTVRLERLTAFGPLDEEVEGWLSGAGISYVHYPEPAAQFSRA